MKGVFPAGCRFLEIFHVSSQPPESSTLIHAQNQNHISMTSYLVKSQNYPERQAKKKGTVVIALPFPPPEQSRILLLTSSAFLETSRSLS
ncbi:hypothetical protein L1887_02945 [Cichorium endivia]|nr:hypothetical protein L1887_02945 [Cichorium endivia]